MPCHLSGNARRVAASSSHESTRTESSPRLVVITSPATVIQSPRLNAQNASNSGESSYTSDEPPAPLDPSQPLAGQTVYAIDAMSLIFQVFHAIPEMTSPRGEPVNAVLKRADQALYRAKHDGRNRVVAAAA